MVSEPEFEDKETECFEVGIASLNIKQVNLFIVTFRISVKVTLQLCPEGFQRPARSHWKATTRYCLYSAGSPESVQIYYCTCLFL